MLGVFCMGLSWTPRQVWTSTAMSTKVSTPANFWVSLALGSPGRSRVGAAEAPACRCRPLRARRTPAQITMGVAGRVPAGLLAAFCPQQEGPPAPPIPASPRRSALPVQVCGEFHGVTQNGNSGSEHRQPSSAETSPRGDECRRRAITDTGRRATLRAVPRAWRAPRPRRWGRSRSPNGPTVRSGWIRRGPRPDKSGARGCGPRH